MARRRIRRICIYCGSNPGKSPRYLAAAREMGALLAEKEIGLVFGGGRVGMMGAVADAVMAGGGEVLGVIPGALASREVAHTDVTHLYVVATMHERKAKMERLADAFIALPGGFGTYEEILEMLTWTQLGLHAKPCGFLNVGGFYNPLLAQFRLGIREGFIPRASARAVVAERTPARLLARVLRHVVPPPSVRWNPARRDLSPRPTSPAPARRSSNRRARPESAAA